MDAKYLKQSTKIEFLKTISDGEMTKINVIDLEKLYNFAVDNFLFEFILLRKTTF
jgi:hypothetical protein